MKTIVITGSTRGIGYALAEAFLDLGCAVAVSGRSEETVQEALNRLLRRFGRERIFGRPCDVREPAELEALWSSSRSALGRVDMWVNNAGIANPLGRAWELPEETLKAVVEANVLGTMYGARIALNGMFAQGYGAVYNMLGFGSSGRKQEGLLPYGTTKAALKYFSDGLAAEVSGTAVLVGSLSPGMVLTDMMTASRRSSPQIWEQVRRVLNLLGDRPETVAPWMAKRMLENRRNGVEIRWLTTRRLIWRLLTYPFNRQRVVS